MANIGAMTSPRLITRAAALSAAAVLLLAGCGDAGDTPIDPVDTTQAPPADDDPGEDTTDAPAEDDSTDSTDGPTDDDTDDGSSDTDGSADAADHADVLSAIDLAENETGGTAFELDDADGGNWEIEVAVGDDELDVLVNSDGSEVLAVEPDGSLDGEDRAGLEAATITIAEAIEIAAEHGTGMIDEVDLSSEGDTFVWEVEFTDDTEVYVNVDGGEVLRVETD